MNQKELNDVLTNKIVEQSNQLISIQILLYSLVDLVIEKELVSKVVSFVSNKNGCFVLLNYLYKKTFFKQVG